MNAIRTPVKGSRKQTGLELLLYLPSVEDVVLASYGTKYMLGNRICCQIHVEMVIDRHICRAGGLAHRISVT